MAEALEKGPFDPDGYRVEVASSRERIARLSETELDAAIDDPDRRARYNGATWDFSVVGLTDCSVWPTMGNRMWASGPVPRVAKKLPTRAGPHDKIFQMAQIAQVPFTDLPLIVFRRKRSPHHYRIDDGCHRAVACFLAGYRQLPAFIGNYSGPGELAWPWEGGR